MKKISFLLFCSFLALTLSAQTTVSLVVSGDGKTKSEATAVALRSAIEQAFGTFVSANSTILNDDLVKDEIATVSSGNIESYDELSSFDINGKWEVSLKAVVSINKLVNYVKGKGAETEFAGQTFAMQMRMRALNKENEKKALTDLIRIVNDLTCNYSLYDYTLNQKEPQYVDGDLYSIPIDVTASRNDNFDNVESIVLKTFQSLALSEAEIAAYTANNYPTCKCKPLGVMGGRDVFCLRSEENFLRTVEELITRNLIINLHCFQLARVGSGNDYLSFFKCFDREIKVITNPYKFSFSPIIPQNVLYNTVGFKVIPDLSLRNPTAECVDLGLSVNWATLNVGASPIYPRGEFFAWGETEPKSNYSWSTYKWCNGSDDKLTKYNTNSSRGTVDNNTVLDPEDDAAHVTWGGSWRMPTDAEWDELIDNCTWTWTTDYNGTGVKGRIVTSNMPGYTDKYIFLPAAGYLIYDRLESEGLFGYFWSSSLYLYGPDSAGDVSFYFSDRVRRVSNEYRYHGQSVRPVCPKN